MNYEELLWTDEWLTFRHQIKERDNETCTKCSRSQFRESTDEEFAEILIESGYGKYLDCFTGEYQDSRSELSLYNDSYPSRFIFDKTVKLEVHHKYYVWNKFPWEYDFSALTTLCDSCHRLVHSQKPIVYTDGTLKIEKILIDCQRCGGTGYLDEYKHIQNGICFNCGGLGGLPETGDEQFVIKR